MKMRALTREYSNFDLSIAHRHDGTYSLRGDHDHGSVTERDGVVLPAELLGVTTKSIEGSMQDAGSGADDGPPRDFGKALFRAIFQGDLLDQLKACSRDSRNPERGVRLRLRLDKAPELASLPWELLYDPGAGPGAGHFADLEAGKLLHRLGRYREAVAWLTPLSEKPLARVNRAAIRT